jgi:membrane associated rhomboid family serine protease
LPLIGASGGISGLLVYYGLKFPHAQLGVALRFFFVIFDWREFSAWRILIVWVLLQILGAVLQVRGQSHVASLAHLGGGVAGAVFWLIWKVWPFDRYDDDDL